MRYVWSILGLLVFGYLTTCITQIQRGERAIVRRFGRIVATPGAGLYVGLPWGMDKVDRIAVDQVRRIIVGYQPDGDLEDVTTPPGQLLSGDENLVNLQVVVDYAIESEELESYLLHANRLEGILARSAEAIMAEWVSRRPVDEVLLRGKVDLPNWLRPRLNALLHQYQLGVAIQGASVTHLYPPTEVKLAFDEVNRAETAIRARENEARQLAAQRVREAETEKQRIEKQTQAYVHEQKVQSKADAERFLKRLEQYQLLSKDNPRYLEALWWEEMGKLFTKLREGGRVDLLDHHLGADGLDITVTPPTSKKR